MTAAQAALLFSAVFLFAADSGAESRCIDDQRFGDDGRLIKWDLCESSRLNSFVGPGADRFRIALKIAGRDTFEKLDWVEDHDNDSLSYHAVDSKSTVSLTRSIQRVSSRRLVETISIKNLSPFDLPQMTLVLDVGSSVTNTDQKLSGLASHLYAFERAFSSTDFDDWRFANHGDNLKKLALAARHKILVVESSERVGLVHDEQSAGEGEGWGFVYIFDSMKGHGEQSIDVSVSAMSTSILELDDLGFRGLAYADLWTPLATLSKTIEALLYFLSGLTGNAGLAIVLLAVAIRLFTAPITYWSFLNQRKFVAASTIMKPKISEIRENYKGAEQSERILAVYKEQNVSPFTGLKGSVGLFVQIPFLLAVFHVTTASILFYNAPFLWVEDLSLSDAILHLPFTMPLFGDAINALPLTLGLLNILSASRDKSDPSTSGIIPVAFSILLVILFYSVSAALVLYWLTINILQISEKAIFGRRHDRTQSE